MRARRADAADSTCSTACCPAPRPPIAERRSAAGARQPAEVARMGRLRRCAADWRGGAALHVDTGMNRLGLTVDEAAALAPRRPARRSRRHAADEPLRLRRRAGASAQRAADQRFRELRALLPPASRLARQLVRHLPRHRAISTWCGPALRSTAAIRRPARPTRCSPWSRLARGSCRCATSSRARPSATARPGPRERADALAIVALGYADGFLRAASGGDGQPAPTAIVARHALPARRPRLDGPASRVDVTDLPPARRGAATGDLIGADRLTIGAPRTIGYEDSHEPWPRYHRLRGAHAGSDGDCRTASTAGAGELTRRWPRPPRLQPSSARTAAPSMRAGRASARPAASGTRSSRKALPRAPRAPGARAAQGPPVRARTARRRDARGAARCRPASPSSTASPAAASCAARCCWSAAIPASASRPCCCRSPRALAARRPARRLHLRRGGGRAGAPARRAARARQAPVELAAETNVEDILATLGEGKPPRLVIIDSIQTMWTDSVEAAPGTVTQVRGAAQALIRFAKSTGAAVILVGHVTKDGQIAGPRVVEHMVDAVLSFEGEGGAPVPHPARRQEPLRPDRRDRRVRDDRRGPARSRQPLRAVSCATATSDAPGTAVFAGMEGTRPLLVEIQALVAPTSLGTPRRAVVGWDPSRLSMVLAVLEAHCGVRLGGHDVYLNVAGGLRIKRAGRRPRRGGRAGLVADQCAAAGRRGLFRRDLAVGRGAAGRASCGAPQGSRRSSASTRPSCRRRAPASRRRLALTASGRCRTSSQTSRHASRKDGGAT